MARKEVDQKDIMWIDWTKVAGMIIGLVIAIISVTIFVSMAR